MPATTAVEVASSRPSSATSPIAFSDVEHEAVVREDRLPRDRPDEVRDEERRDHEDEEDVLPAPGAERDPVGERVAEEERDERRDPGVDERADQLLAVVRDGLGEVRERPRELEVRVDPGLERLVGEVAEREDEEEEEPQHPGREQRERRGPAVAVEEAHCPRPARGGFRPGESVECPAASGCRQIDCHFSM